jgi:hypothetical protein
LFTPTGKTAIQSILPLKAACDYLYFIPSHASPERHINHIC